MPKQCHPQPAHPAATIVPVDQEVSANSGYETELSSFSTFHHL